MVGALSWIFLLILKERSGSSLPSLLMHSPASNDTPSMSSDTSRTFRTSTGATAKRQERWVGLIMAWIFRYLSSQPSQHLNYSSFRLKSDTLMMHAFYHNRMHSSVLCCQRRVADVWHGQKSCGKTGKCMHSNSLFHFLRLQLLPCSCNTCSSLVFLLSLTPLSRQTVTNQLKTKKFLSS